MGGQTQSATGVGTGFLGQMLTGIIGGAAGGGLDANGIGAWSTTATQFASGGLVSGATAFSHAGGMGVMGEAGTEAIMPVRRLPNGNFGVEAMGGGGKSLTINFAPVVHGDLSDGTRERLMADMKRLLASEAPGIVKNSVSAVRVENQRNPSFLRR